MTRYAIRSVDEEGAVLLTQRLACSDDLEALAEGVRHAGHHAVEIFDGSRLVARVKLGNAPLDSRDARCL